METKFLFREDPYIDKIKAKIISVDGNNVVLDKTIFFSFSGGQESDSGTIGEKEVVSSNKEEKRIIYTLEDDHGLKEGDEIEVKINSAKREKLRRLHSGTHIVGDIFEKKHNMPISDIVGSNVDVSKGRLDYALEDPVSSLLPDLEKEVNEFLQNNIEVKHFIHEGDRWMWECGDIKMECGGTHVRNTKEIGKIKLKRKNIGAGKERIEVMLVD